MEVAAIAGPEDAQELIRRGREAEASDPKAAFELFTRALDADKSSPQAWYHLGRMMTLVGQTQNALKWLQRSLELDDAQPDAWLYFGLAFRQAGELKQAVQCFEMALSRDDSIAAAWECKASTLLHGLGEPEKALPCFDRALALERSASTLQKKALCLLKLARPAEAAACFDEGLTGCGPIFPEIWLYRAEAEEGRGRLPLARQFYETLLAQKDADPRAVESARERLGALEGA